MKRLFVLGQTDLVIMARLETFIPVCLVLSSLMALAIIMAWTIPGFVTLLPDGWWLMKANTALAILLCTVSSALNWRNNGILPRILMRVSALGAALLACGALVQHSFGIGASLSTLFANDAMSTHPGLMSAQSGVFIILLSTVSFVNIRSRGYLGYAMDCMYSSLLALIFVFFAGYLFNADSLIGQSNLVKISPQTLACLSLLTYVQIVRRDPFKFVSSFMGLGIGSKFSQIMLPVAVLISYALFYLEKIQIEKWGAGTYTAIAISAALMATLLGTIISIMARKINSLEFDLRQSSLTDDMTKLYNRRGFNLFAEQVLSNSRRFILPVTVIYCDVDGLKKVNDEQGHEVGSRMITDVSSILNSIFRNNDVVGRIGGDEFAVVSYGNMKSLDVALQRLKEAIDEENCSLNKPYRISVSIGSVESNPLTNESLDDLLRNADEAMYRQKVSKKVNRETNTEENRDRAA